MTGIRDRLVPCTVVYCFKNLKEEEVKLKDCISHIGFLNQYNINYVKITWNLIEICGYLGEVRWWVFTPTQIGQSPDSIPVHTATILASHIHGILSSVLRKGNNYNTGISDPVS